MGLRQREWAARVRSALLADLGGRCEYCGSTQDLEFDCILPDGHKSHHARMDPSWRMSFYRQQHEAGNLQILCTHCNSRKGDTLPEELETVLQNPF